MTNGIVKLMYKRDKIHELAVKRKDGSLMSEYRKLRNIVTDMIKKNTEKGSILRTSVIHHVQILVRFGQSLVVSYPRSMLNQSLET